MTSNDVVLAQLRATYQCERCTARYLSGPLVVMAVPCTEWADTLGLGKSRRICNAVCLLRKEMNCSTSLGKMFSDATRRIIYYNY